MKKFLMVLLAITITVTAVGCGKPQTGSISSYGENNIKLDGGLLDFNVALNDAVIQFPTDYDTFLKSGFELKSNEKHAALASGQYALFKVTNGTAETEIFFANFSDTEQKAADCAVCGINADENDAVSITLPQGITLGKSDKATVEAAFGEPSTRESGDGKTTFTYGDEKIGATLVFSGGRFTSISLLKITNPIYNNASDKTPTDIKSYKKPTQISQKLEDMTFYLYGGIYRFPTPVSTLIDDGWVLVSKTDEYVAAGETKSDAVKLTRANRTITFDVKNTADYATTVENCLIAGIKSTSSTKLDMTLYDGCRVGSAKSTFLAYYDEKEFTDIEKSGNKTVYTYEAEAATLKVTVNDNSGYVTKIAFTMQ